ncbi:cupin domain-containing protein [Vitreimonas sp.]|uniref:cupin domain-containing protein n=1 Tax=Vitreimonas sp. TaxID=3069702 RepID=UPI002ED86C6D
MPKLYHLDETAPAESGPISPDRLVEGAPIETTALEYERDGKVFVGVWSATVGAWRVRYDEWEFCHMLEGVCEIVSDEDGETKRFSSGDSFVIEPGFVGVWRVIVPMKKRFIIRYD